MNFHEAVASIHDWATANGATIRITRARGIVGDDGKVWDSFMVDTQNAHPGAAAKFNQQAMQVIRRTPGNFDFIVGV